MYLKEPICVVCARKSDWGYTRNGQRACRGVNQRYSSEDMHKEALHAYTPADHEVLSMPHEAHPSLPCTCQHTQRCNGGKENKNHKKASIDGRMRKGDKPN